MGFKDFLGKVKDGAAGAAKVTARYNADFYGNVDYGEKNSDFAPGCYLNMEKCHGLIYGSKIEDYTFTANDIAEYKWLDTAPSIKKGGESHPASRCEVVFKDGKTARLDIMVSKVPTFKQTFKMDK